ncbi:Aste57867_25235 [Aphanomyces stellatus]|uniref:Aste57867_25235 protein n=1 Tax=Aphanomyces stellatus TaxID=120398 RepID=A0A485LTZ4_9STRA|nr:hypothetical protein As57867_025157 [Aphanomyces stellatus]VFU01862.1 Aste57867_25235 [Aphanomyces stellatus]
MARVPVLSRACSWALAASPFNRLPLSLAASCAHPWMFACNPPREPTISTPKPTFLSTTTNFPSAKVSPPSTMGPAAAMVTPMPTTTTEELDRASTAETTLPSTNLPTQLISVMLTAPKVSVTATTMPPLSSSSRRVGGTIVIVVVIVFVVVIAWASIKLWRCVQARVASQPASLRSYLNTPGSPRLAQKRQTVEPIPPPRRSKRHGMPSKPLGPAGQPAVVTVACRPTLQSCVMRVTAFSSVVPVAPTKILPKKDSCVLSFS